MKKLYLFVSTLLLEGSSFAAQGDPYWYVRGAFNDYAPDFNDEWALMDDDEGDANVYSGTFSVPAGEFSFNLMNSEEQIFVPMNKSMYTTPMVVTFTDNVFKGNSSLAWDDYEESYYWTCPEWEGGQITISVNASGNNPSITIYAIPEVNEYNDNYTISTLENDVLAIYWTDNVDDIWYQEGDAYIETEAGNDITLKKALSGQEGVVYLIDSDPYGLNIDLKALNLSEGDYTLVIPAGYLQIVTNDYEDFLLNPEIRYEFKVNSTKVTALQNSNEVKSVFNLQGVKVDPNKLSNGIYIINGKKVIIQN
ncbi:MAG: hypothetical protein J1E82_03410 [Muribaculaceae bacterium]|nr:hypothetical protein [Muribaculaceae bacterium]